MSNLIDSLRAEIIALEGDIPKLELGVAKAQTALRSALEKVDRVRGLLALYEAEDVAKKHQIAPSEQMLPFGEEIPAFSLRDVSLKVARVAATIPPWAQSRGVIPAPPWSATAIKNASVSGATRAETKKDAMIREVSYFLSLRGKAHRAEILEYLGSRGIDLGKSPLPSLAAFLSDHRTIFESDGRGNFSIRSAHMTQEEHVEYAAEYEDQYERQAAQNQP